MSFPRPPAAAVAAGLLACLVGFTSSFSVVLQGLRAAGATQGEAASGLMAVSVAMGACGLYLSLRTRMPVLVAWSTPGAALLASSGAPAGGFREAVGAFVMAGLLVIAAGLWRPLGRLVVRIPATIANAMLAGVLFALCLAPLRALQAEPLAALAVVAAWLVVGRVKRLFAVPAAALVAAALIVAGAPPGVLGSGLLVGPHPVLVVPQFTLAGFIGLALPLFIVTMASQNVPGLAILSLNGYRPEPGPLLTATGVASVLAAPFGSHAVNLGALTAALIASEEAGPDPARRWWGGATSGAVYVAFGLGAAAVTAFASLQPLLIEAVAGLALIGAFSGSLSAAAAAPAEREAATITFLVAASGIAFLGVSAAFWGLVAGGAVLALGRLGRRAPEAAKPEAAKPSAVR